MGLNALKPEKKCNFETLHCLMTCTLERLNKLNHNLVKKPSSLLANFIIYYDLIHNINQFNECDWLIY